MANFNVNDDAIVAKELQEMKEWMSSERFKYTERPYTPEQVVACRGDIGSVTSSEHMYAPLATKLYNLVRARFNEGKYSHTFGCLDPVQLVQMNKYLETVYVSGWQASSTASSSNEPGPDFADYPANSLPQKVDQLFKAQQFHARKQRNARSKMSAEEKKNTPVVDYFRPIVADGDTGFGGMTSVTKLIKMMIESGASGVHLEDQKVGAKKCGHLGGKVLVPVREHADRMAAARLQADIMKHPLVLVCRTDADSANFLENDIDPRDHPYIAGATNKEVGFSVDAEDPIAWMDKAGLMRYSDAVAAAMKKAGKGNLVDKWMKDSMALSNDEAKALATKLGFGDVFWCKQAPRSREGFFRVIGGIDYAVMRAIAFSPVSDMIWCETSTPSIPEIADFANGVHAVVPHQICAYNLSPSFNWSIAGSDNDIRNFQKELGKLGITWHFVTLFGFHTNALAIDQAAKAYAGPDGMLAYVQMVQNQERVHGVETLTHQKWSGAELMDDVLQAATGGGASTSALHGATEDQFKQSKL
ncbi:Isocitrate lyase [Hondaea fermentalgiana]|uniref:Isocitrate lyase n=1 Tax=Hondaea fermentalgiana TaxID=2315210 RepID=A0A2R5G264_9STRA|nr:Isocitrate lyase [Hondaea fermentalgiana]|eukprot:GBG25117.1 Isocitrate lyase [Hondaea fermentalgiana]